MNWKKILFNIFFTLSLLCGTVLSVAIFFYLSFYIPANNKPYSEKTEFEIPAGTPFMSIQNMLKEKGLIGDKKRFYYAARFAGKLQKLQAGHYQIPGGTHYFQLVRLLSNAPRHHIRVTIPEGLESWEIADILEAHLQIPKDTLLYYIKNPLLAGIPDSSLSNLEGYLYPDTYFLYEDISPKELLQRFWRQFNTIYSARYQARADSLNLSRNQVITMASIIQGEVMIWDEAPVISSVYWNRIKKRMHLNADPTIQFIVEGPKIRLRNRHLEIDSPYNTYKNYGLPPGPVNSPGQKAIEAALWPAKSNYLYFVAKGDGSHVFTTNLKDHNQAKRDFQRVRWEVSRQKKKSGN
ncbi:MAG TPA: endolytic transglycosylase MltG [Candidatus Marinimicrobia bacterium]|nr:endolytic transglycosylase MltG [Candidatus Neomarinimicrobiota bacterium]